MIIISPSAGVLPVGKPESIGADCSSKRCSSRGIGRVLHGVKVVGISNIRRDHNSLAVVKVNSNSERSLPGADSSSVSLGDGSSIELNSANFVCSSSSSSSNTILATFNGYVVT